MPLSAFPIFVDDEQNGGMLQLFDGCSKENNKTWNERSKNEYSRLEEIRRDDRLWGEESKIDTLVKKLE